MTIQLTKKIGTMAFALAFIAGMHLADASTLIVTTQGSGLYSIQGVDMGGVAAIDITLNYDTRALGNPRVEQGMLISGAMVAVNQNVPGVIRIAVIRLTPITGSGTIFTLTFNRVGSSSNPITSLVVRLTDANGNVLPAQAQVMIAPETATTSTQPPAVQNANTGTARDTVEPEKQVVTPIIAPGVIVKSQESETSQDRPPVTVETIQPDQEPYIAKADDAAHRGEERSQDIQIKGKAVYTQKSVLDLFKAYIGPRTPKALMALFEQDSLIGCRQEPPLVLSDGKSLARVSFITPVEQKSSPDVALIGASMVSMERDRENSNTWIALVRPNQNVTEAKMTISLNDAAIVIPLTVAPKVDISVRAGMVTEEDFDLYLKGFDKKKSHGRDLNGDNKSNYLDDYIFTANYLAAIKAYKRPASLR